MSILPEKKPTISSPREDVENMSREDIESAYFDLIYANSILMGSDRYKSLVNTFLSIFDRQTNKRTRRFSFCDRNIKFLCLLLTGGVKSHEELAVCVAQDFEKVYTRETVAAVIADIRYWLKKIDLDIYCIYNVGYYMCSEDILKLKEMIKD